MKLKYKLIIIISVLGIIISSALYISYAFIGSEVTGNDKAKQFVSLSQAIKIEYSDGNEIIDTLNGNYFAPGSTLTKSFTLKNTGNVNINFGVKLSDVINEFERTEDLIYELYLDNTLLISDTMPTEDKVIAYSQTLNVGETKSYVLKIIYKESNENQIIDQNKLLSAKIDFVQTKNVLSNIKIIGNSSQGKESLFDKENATILQAYINTSANQLGYPYTDSTTFLIPCEKNTKYLVSYDYNNAKTSIFRTGYITVSDPTAKKWNNVYATDYTANADHYVTTNDKATYLVIQIGKAVHKKAMESLKVEYVISPESPREIISAGDKTVNLFEYKEPEVVNGTIIEKLENGAIVKGNMVSTPSDNLYDSGWFRPGHTNAGATGIILNKGDVVTVSADITLLKVGDANKTKSTVIHLYPREDKNGHGYPGNKMINLTLNKKVRVSETFTIDDRFSGYMFYPIFTLNGQTLKIENIQVAYGEQTEYEPYNKYKLPLKVDDETYNIYMNEPLRKVGECETCYDYIDLRNSTLKRNLQEKIFDENDIFDKDEEITKDHIYLHLGYDTGEDSENVRIKSNYFKGVSRYYLHMFSGNIISQNLTYIRVKSDTSITDNGDTFNSWVKAKYDEGNPFIAIFQRENIIEENIDLPNIYSINPDADISINSTIPATLVVE